MVHISQYQADLWLAVEKFKIDDNPYTFPSLGGELRIPLISKNPKENFTLDIRRFSIKLEKNTFQVRIRTSVILARIDIGGPPHRNPNGIEIPCPHIHVYREGYGDKWAKALPPDVFSNPTDSWKTLEEFMIFCNIVRIPNIERDLLYETKR